MTTTISVRQLATTAMMTALLVVLGLFPGIPLGLIPVPIVLQNLDIMLVGALLRARFGTISVGLLLLMAFIGLPVLSGGRGGAAVFFGPTGGYLIGWLLAPALISGLSTLWHARETHGWWRELVIILLIGVGLVDLIGSLWLAGQSHMALSTALLSNAAFLPGDILKAIIAVLLARRLRPVLKLA